MLKLILFFFAIVSIQSHCGYYKPVCGMNRVTYSSPCSCRRARAVVAYEGPCRTSVHMPGEYWLDNTKRNQANRYYFYYD